jgi:hypothetical protein
VKLLTGNDLVTGDVTWWTGQGWSVDITAAADAGEDAASVMALEEAARRVNVPYVVDAEMSDTGPRPLNLKDRIRAGGPTVRLDLARSACGSR